MPFRKPSFLHEWTEYDRTSPEEVATRLAKATIAVTNKVKLREAELTRLPNVRFIALASTGYDAVDTAWCRAHGVVVSNVPGYTGAAVPEHVFMLILALRRHLRHYDGLVRDGAWAKAPFFALQDAPIRDIDGSTLGLIGFGGLAKAVEVRAKAFGMNVLIAERKGAVTLRPGRASFHDVLSRSDVISIHSPLNTETRGMIGTDELASMKRDALLINTARGGIVDETALAAALRAGKLGGAGIDVLTQEPPRDGNPLLDPTIPNLIVTPHNAWASRQALATLAEEMVLNMEAFVARKPRNVVS